MKVEKKQFKLTTTSFEEGWKKIKEALVEANNMFSETEDSIDAVNERMLELFSKHIPKFNKSGNIRFWALNIQTMRSCLKVGKNISYAWNIDKLEYVKGEDGKTTTIDIKEITFSVILYNPEHKFYQQQALLNAGFTLVE